ncbi:MAG: hypothetical protein QFB87_01355 [Patescibacteria group bacterium]|nr:hypothetical protein [Patescibacteria group bacterium]
MATLETAFLTWEADARRLDFTCLPDVQVPLIALAGTYSCVTGLPKNVHSFRKTVTANSQLCVLLAEVTPENMRDEFEDDEKIPIASLLSQYSSHARARCENLLLEDGLPDNETMISSREYFLTRFLGQAAYNYTVNLQPLRIDLRHARPPLQHFFPRSLDLIEKHL